MGEHQAEIMGPKIAVIGGGTGNFTVLSGLKPLAGEGLTAIVSMADDGGSTGELRDQYGVLPPGDLRQCLVALSNSPDDVRELFNFRFGEGEGARAGERGLKGQNFGNLLISAAEKISGDITQAVRLASRVLNITGEVIPVTRDNRRLIITTLDGQVIRGEHQAESTDIPSLRGAQIGFDKEPTDINPEAEAAIMEADEVVIAPGDLYTSIAPALAVRGMSEALKRTDGKVIYVSNLMNRERHTVGFDVPAYATEIERIVGEKVLDYVLYNTDEPDQELLDLYEIEGELPVAINGDALGGVHYTAVGKKLLSREKPDRNANDALANTRSLIRHNPRAVGRAIMAIHYGNGRD